MADNTDQLTQLLENREEVRARRNEAIRQQWLISENRRRALESSFPAFEGRVRQILSNSKDVKTGAKAGPTDRRRRLYVLPVSPGRLARQAEETDEFHNLVSDLCGLDPRERDYDPDVVDPHWVSDLFLPGLLWRSGFYDAVIANQPTEEIQKRIVDRAPVLEREVVYLRLLEGCRFVQDRFDVCGYSIVRMSAAETEALGAPPTGHHESDSQWSVRRQLMRHWVLQEVATSRSGCIDIRQKVPNREESDHGSKRATKSAGKARIWLDSYLFPLLVLALYSDERFEIPSILRSEPGWSVSTLVSNPVRRQTSYEVDEASWAKFEAFVKIGEEALDRCQSWVTGLPGPVARRLGFSAISLWRPIGIASRHYLQSTFASGDVLPGWVPSDPNVDEPFYMELGIDAKNRETAIEDELLHYVFCLEALLTGDEKDAISHKIATCAALIVGRDDEERNWIAKFVKKAYGVRSDIVHGRAPATEVDLLKLRRLCQRLLAIVFSLIMDHESPEAFEQTLRQLTISDALRRLVEGKTRNGI